MPPVLTTIIGPLVVNAPLVAALVVCLVLTMKRRAQDPGGAQLVIVGLALAFLSLLLSAAGWILAAVALIRTRRSSQPAPTYGQQPAA